MWIPLLRMGLLTEPISLTLEEAEVFLINHERHYKMPADPVCAIGLAEDGVLVGAAILGRDREDGSGKLAHIYVNGAFHGYTLLYGACWRAYHALGYKTVHL